MLHLGVVDHRPRQRNGRFRLQLFDEHLAGPQADPVIDVRKVDQRPREKSSNEHVGSGGARGDHAWDVLVGHKRSVEHRVVASCSAHPHHIPRFFDRVAFRVPCQKEVDNLPRFRIARVHGVSAEPRPHRRKTAERLPTGDLIATLDALCFRRREQTRNVVAMFGVARCENFAGGCIFEDPFAGFVAPACEVGRGPDPVVVHVDAQRGRRRVLCEPACFARHLRERHAHPAELLRNGHLQIPGGLQFVEVLQAELVVAIVAWCTLTAPVKKSLGEYGTGSRGHESPKRYRCAAGNSSR